MSDGNDALNLKASQYFIGDINIKTRTISIVEVQEALLEAVKFSSSTCADISESEKCNLHWAIKESLNAEIKTLRWAMSLCAAGQPTGMIYGQLKKRLEEIEK